MTEVEAPERHVIVDSTLTADECRVINTALWVMEERLAAVAEQVLVQAVTAATQAAAGVAAGMTEQYLQQRQAQAGGSQPAGVSAEELRYLLVGVQRDATAAALEAFRNLPRTRKDVVRDIHGDIVSIVESSDEP